METVVPVLTGEAGVVRTAGYGEVMGERRSRQGSPAPPSGKGQDAQGLGVQGRWARFSTPTELVTCKLCNPCHLEETEFQLWDPQQPPK